MRTKEEFLTNQVKDSEVVAPSPTQDTGAQNPQSLDSATVSLLQKSSFFLFTLLSFFIVSQVVLGTLWPTNPVLHRYAPELIAFVAAYATGFLIISLYENLIWLHPVLLLASTPVPLSINISSMYSFAAFVIAIVELYRMGYFRRSGFFKISIIFTFYIMSIALVGTALNVFIIEIITANVFVVFFFLYLIPVFQGKWQITVVRPREKIRYGELNLSKRETDFLKACLSGESFKEIAVEHHVSESTVRNTFAHIYRKFNVNDRADLLSKFADFDIID